MKLKTKSKTKNIILPVIYYLLSKKIIWFLYSLIKINFFIIYNNL